MRRLLLALPLLLLAAARPAAAMPLPFGDERVRDEVRVARADAAVADDEPTPAPTATPSGEDQPPPQWNDRPKYVPPLFIYVHSTARQSDFFMLGMLWWQASNPDRRYHLLFPLWYDRTDLHTHGTTYAGPLWYFYSSPTGKAGYIPPVYIERGLGVSRTGIPPLFWYGRVGDEVTSYFLGLYLYDERAGHKVLATPLGGGWGTKDDWQGFVGPYYWRDTHTPELTLRAHVLFPIFWQFSGRDWSTWDAGPVFSSTRTTADGGVARAFGALPFFYERTSPHGAATIVTPLSIYERHDPQRRWLLTPVGGFRRSPNYALDWWGPYFQSRSGDFHMWSLWPLLLFHGQSPRLTWTILGPYVQTYSASSDESFRLLAPVFFYDRHAGDTLFVSWLAAWHRNRDAHTLRGFWGPLYLNQSPRTQTAFLLPGIWYHHSPTVSTSFGAVPFWYVHKKNGETNTGLFPVAYFSNYVDATSHERDRTAWLLPLFYYGEHPGRLTFLSPVYTQIRTPDERRIMAAWLWWDDLGRDHRTSTLIPFFHWRRFQDQRELITPVGGYEKSDGFLRAFWGPYYRLRDDNAHVKRDVVFPWFWRLDSPDHRYLVALPYYREREGDYFREGFVPFWFHSSIPGSSQTVVMPLFMVRRDTIQKTQLIVTPLGGLWTQENPRAHKLLAPLVYQASGPEKRTAVLFPLFWYDWDHGRQTVVLPPFFSHTDRDAHSLTTGFVPLWFYHRDPDTTLLLTPGVFYTRDRDERQTLALPLAYWWKRNATMSEGIAGPWIWKKDRTDSENRFRLLLPVFLERLSHEHALLATPVFVHDRKGNRTWDVFPGFGWATRRDANGETVSRAIVAGPLYLRTAPGAADAVLFPIFWHTHDLTHAITTVPPVFLWERAGVRSRLLTFLGGYGKEPDLDRSWWWALNTFSIRSGERRQSAFLPFVYTDRSPHALTLATPLFFWRDDHDTATRTVIAPLWYSRTSPERSTHVVFPLFYLTGDRKARSQDGGVIPFAFWHRDPERASLTIPLALSFWRREGNDHVGVFGPWIDVQAGDRRTIAMFPVFRWHRDPEATSFASLPFIWVLKHDGFTRAFVGLGYWNTETGTRVFPGYVRVQSIGTDGTVKSSTSVGIPFVHYATPAKDILVVGLWYRVRHSADKSVVHGVAPFWNDYRAPGNRSWSVLGNLVGYDRIGRYRRLTFFWGFHKNLKTLPAEPEEHAATLRSLADGTALGVPPADAEPLGVQDSELASE